jgi:Kinesin motor domain
MLGGGAGSSEEGIIGRSVRMMFEKKVQIAALARDAGLVRMSVEVLEVYNEKAYCLINNKDSTEQGLKVTQDGVDGNRVVEVNSLDEVMKILRLAQKQRCVKQTDLNATSSRSHLVFTLNFQVGSTQCGKLNICDLAGSERIKKSGVQVRYSFFIFCHVG